MAQSHTVQMICVMPSSSEYIDFTLAWWPGSHSGLNSAFKGSEPLNPQDTSQMHVARISTLHANRIHTWRENCATSL